MVEDTTRTREAALVTGASSGIGAELAKQISRDGYDLVLTARRETRLQRIAETLEDRYGVTATVIPRDLADPTAPQDLFDAVQEAGIRIHTLVNNAGFPIYGRFHETELEAELDMIRVNIAALTAVTKLFVRPMIERDQGGILNTGSITGYYPSPTASVYAATKAYVMSFTRALAHELDATNITVTALCPGAVDTEFMETGGMDESGADEGITNDPASVAEAGWQGHKAGERIVWPSRTDTILAQLPRILPHRTVTSLGEEGFEEGTSFVR